MMKLSITNINKMYLKVLQLKLHEYYDYLILSARDTTYENLCATLLFIEVTPKVANDISKKIDQYKVKPVSLKLTITEAIVLQSACIYLTDGDNLVERAAYQFICDQVHQQITNIQL